MLVSVPSSGPGKGMASAAERREYTDQTRKSQVQMYQGIQVLQGRRSCDCYYAGPMARVLVFADHSVDDCPGTFQYPFAHLHLGDPRTCMAQSRANNLS